MTDDPRFAGADDAVAVDPLKERCAGRLQKIVDTKDEGYHAKWYAEDVRALLGKVARLECEVENLVMDMREHNDR